MAGREQRLSRKEDQILAAHKRADKDAIAQARQLVDSINRRLEGVIAGIRSKGGQLTGDDIRTAKGAVALIRSELEDRASGIETSQPGLEPL